MEWKKGKAKDEMKGMVAMKTMKGIYAHLHISRNSDIDVKRRRKRGRMESSHSVVSRG